MGDHEVHKGHVVALDINKYNTKSYKYTKTAHKNKTQNGQNKNKSAGRKQYKRSTVTKTLNPGKHRQVVYKPSRIRAGLFE
jgi:hypothetical protein